MKKLSVPALVCLLLCAHATAQLVLSGNENKIDLAPGAPTGVTDAPPDSVSILDFSQFPPGVRHLIGIKNSVIGPPSNIAITPDHAVALIASSVVLDPAGVEPYIPDNLLHVLDLTLDPPKVIQEIETDAQPSGISITRDGRRALIANRAAGTVSMYAIDGKQVSLKQTLKVCEPEDSVADVAINPEGTLAVASVCEAGYMAVIHLDEERMTLSETKLSVCGKPYRCVISPDGKLALTGGSGQGYPNVDALTVMDLTADPPRTTDFVVMGSGPESIEISPDGKLVAAVLMAASSLAPGNPAKEPNGMLVLLARRGMTFEKVQELPTGAIPEGVAFTPDGRYLIVQCHPSRELWLYEVDGEHARDTGERITVPGFPSSLRAAP